MFNPELVKVIGKEIVVLAGGMAVFQGGMYAAKKVYKSATARATTAIATKIAEVTSKK